MERNKDRETEIVARFLKSINITQKPNGTLSQDKFNAHVLAPICIVDVAYGLFQKVFKTEQRHKCKMLIGKMKNLFSEKVYSTRGLFYKGLTQDDVLYLSEYSDMQAEVLDATLEKLYWFVQDAASKVIQDFNKRDVYCKIFTATTLVHFANVLMSMSWHCESSNLNKIASYGTQLAEEYRKQCLGGKENGGIFLNTDQLKELYIEINQEIRKVS